jgi:hypothetical protein
VDELGLVETIWISVHLVGSLTCWRKGQRVTPLFWLLACIVMLSAMLFVVLIWGVVLQDGKRVLALCIFLVDRLQEMDV